jgi:protoporphyrinogen oxidase
VIEKPPAPPIVILGAGVAGLAAAYRLAELRVGPVVVLERQPESGGLAGTSTFAGARFDLGSHRVHPDSYPDALALVRELLGNDLVRVPRRGRLRFHGRFIDYPPSLAGFASALGPREIARCAAALAAERLRRARSKAQRLAAPPSPPSYEDELLPVVGRRAFDLFYAPYVRKVFGLEPDEVAASAAKLRITSAKPWAVARQMLGLGNRRAARDGARAAPGIGASFLYPRFGFGSIGASLRDAATKRGMQLEMGVHVQRLEARDGRIHSVVVERGGAIAERETAAVISSAPLAVLVRLLRPLAPAAVVEAADGLRWRGIRLLQVVLARERCLDGETYYFPEASPCFGRVSEPPLFSEAMRGAPGTTSLNIEVICTPGDAVWSADESAFLALVLRDAESLGLFRGDEILAARSLRLPAVYPVYDRGWAARLERVLGWVRSHQNLYSIGRGGLFLHANTDHSIHLGLRLAEHLASPSARAADWDAALPGSGMTVRD